VHLLNRTLSSIAVLAPFCLISSAQSPPGVVIDHEPTSAGRFIGSPSIAVLPNGIYVASHDFFGPNSGETVSGVTRIFASNDKGRTWRQTAELHDQFWSTLFVHHRQLYLMGTSAEYGRIVIRRASDNGETWTEPSFITSEAGYHTAPVPIVEKNRRLWRAFEYHPAGKWGHFEALMLSAPAMSDLLNPKSWSMTERLPFPPGLSEGQTWLEGNAVIAPDGFVHDILRVHDLEEAANIRVLNDERMVFEGVHSFLGGAKKFTIRFDPQTKLYWSLADAAPTDNPVSATDPASVRNFLVLQSSPDLLSWRTEHIVLTHPDFVHYGFQYVDWQFAGRDIIFVSRTAWDAARAHDANYLTFHRIEDFRVHKSEDY
jgi:hypothetical protein